MLKDIGGDNNWQIRVCLSYNFFEFVFKMIGVGSKTTVKVAFTLEWFFFNYSLFLFEFDFCQFQRMVVGTLSEEKDLLILESLYAILQVVCYLVTGYPIFQVFFPLSITHYLVKLLQLKSPAGQNGLHRFIDEWCECLCINFSQYFRFELSEVSQIL